MRIEDQPMWVAFKHPAPYRGMRWAVKTPRGILGFSTKKITNQFIAITAPLLETSKRQRSIGMFDEVRIVRRRAQ